MRRPISAAKFNGTVIAEWINVSNNWDQEVDWFQTHEHLLQEGYAWVGVSAQRVGPALAPPACRLWSPSRYGALDVTAGNTITDDSLSYDIFSQAVKAVRSPAGLDPLGSLAAPEYVIATGHSQSAGRLRTYANSIQPLSNIVDAVVLHGGGGAMRTDTPTPVFRINSEGDIAGGIGNGARAPDSPTFRNWEVAGASHGDWKLITDYGPLRKRDIGTYPGGYPGEPQTCTLPSLSRVPQHMVQSALYDHTFNWVAYGIAPPSAPVITTTTPTGGTIVRDSLGLAQGGIRLAQQDVPLRVNSGTNTGPGFCFLDGSSLPLTDAQLADALPDRAVLRRQGRRADARQRREGLHPGATSRAIRRGTRTSATWSTTTARGSPSAAAARLRRQRRQGRGVRHGGRQVHGDLLPRATSPRRRRSGIPGDAAARDAVLRPTKAIIALLQATIDAPTSTDTHGDRRRHRARHAVADARRAGVVRRLHAGRHEGLHGHERRPPSPAAPGDATLSVSDPGHLTNGAFSLAEPLRVELAKSAWTAPTSNEKVGLTFKQLVKQTDPLRTGSYSRTLTFTLSTTNP